MTILITGASRGIGKYLFEKLSQRPNTKVLGTYHKTKPPGDSSRYVQVDLSQEEQVAEFVKNHADNLHNVTLLHCAGVNANGFTHKLSKTDWTNVIDGNLSSAFYLTKHLLPLMRAQNYGRIVFFSSIVPEIGVPGTAAYASSKAGLWGLAKVIARENASKNVTCNSLNLGYFNIGMISEVPQEILAKTVQTIPMQRLGDPANIFEAVNFLMNADYISGTQIDINGALY